jgi:NAD(P)H-hydrate repair Nnr-like enzyme with NAD(P)H-hydrate epimerase domain
MVIGLIVATVYFENYFEIILFGVLIDALYGTGASSIFHVPIAYTVFAITMFLLSIPLRKRIRATI